MDSSNTILIVDDQPDGRRLLRKLLADQGYNLTFAISGSDALTKAAELSPRFDLAGCGDARHRWF